MGIRLANAEVPVDQPAARRGPVAAGRAHRSAVFERLATEHLDGSYRLAGAILGRDSDAEDAVHHAFETAWRKWPSLRDPERFGAWLGRIVVDTCRDRLRRASRQRTDELDEQLPARDSFAGMEVGDELDRALLRLKPDEQVVLALSYYRAQARLRTYFSEPATARWTSSDDRLSGSGPFLEHGLQHFTTYTGCGRANG